MSEARTENSFLPLNLQVNGASCLVVGGGKIAARKARHLLSAGAHVTVVSFHLGEEMKALGEYKNIFFREREFQQADATGMKVVFAATNNLKTNYNVIHKSRGQGALTCGADKSWQAGDFITPAVLERDGLVVAISTGGRSCRRSRLVKENLARHLDMVEAADLLVMGTSHHMLPLEQREPLHLTGERYTSTGEMLRQIWGIHEFMLLNTCNRVELMAVVSPESRTAPLLKRILGFDQLSEEQFYFKQGVDAFEHSCMLSAGLLSQTPGEKHIVAQLKEAMGHARDSGWSGPLSEEWMASALHVAKDVRAETAPYLRGGEIEDMALAYLTEACSSLQEKRVFVLGTGDIGTGLVERLLKQYPGTAIEWFYNRNKPSFPSDSNGHFQLHPLAELSTRLPAADIVLCATGSDDCVLTEQHANFFNSERGTFVIDISIPRNVAPGLPNGNTNVDLVDLDDLKAWYHKSRGDLSTVFNISRNTIDDHQDFYDGIMHSFQGRNASQ